MTAIPRTSSVAEDVKGLDIASFVSVAVGSSPRLGHGFHPDDFIVSFNFLYPAHLSSWMLNID